MSIRDLISDWPLLRQIATEDDIEVVRGCPGGSPLD